MTTPSCAIGFIRSLLFCTALATSCIAQTSSIGSKELLYALPHAPESWILQSSSAKSFLSAFNEQITEAVRIYEIPATEESPKVLVKISVIDAPFEEVSEDVEAQIISRPEASERISASFRNRVKGVLYETRGGKIRFDGSVGGRFYLHFEITGAPGLEAAQELINALDFAPLDSAARANRRDRVRTTTYTLEHYDELRPEVSRQYTQQVIITNPQQAAPSVDPSLMGMANPVEAPPEKPPAMMNHME